MLVPCCFRVAIVSSQQQRLFESRRSATQIPRTLHAGANAPEVRKGAIEARIGVHETAVGERLEVLDRLVDRALAKGGHPLLKDRRAVVLCGNGAPREDHDRHQGREGADQGS